MVKSRAAMKAGSMTVYPPESKAGLSRRGEDSSPSLPGRRLFLCLPFLTCRVGRSSGHYDSLLKDLRRAVAKCGSKGLRMGYSSRADPWSPNMRYVTPRL